MRISKLAVSVTAVLKVVIIESMFISSLFTMVRGANFPPIIVWKVSNTLSSGQVLWTSTGRNKTLPPSTSLPAMGGTAGVNTTASLGGYPNSQMGGRVPR